MLDAAAPGFAGRFRSGLGAASAALLLAATAAHAQWRPSGPLASVLVVDDCHETAGDVAATRLEPPTIYLCAHVARLIRQREPGVEHFYFVHEFGHVALATADEASVDCWAAQQLANAAHGGRYLAAAIAHFERRGDEPSPRYGSPRQRAERIRSCAEEARAGSTAFEPRRPGASIGARRRPGS